MGDGKTLARLIEIAEREPEVIIATEFVNIFRDQIAELVNADRDAIFTVVLAAIRFYRDRLREAMWEAEHGAKLREHVKRLVAARVRSPENRQEPMFG